MQTKFYEKALPSQGLYCAAGIDLSGRTYHRFAESLSELTANIQGLQEGGFNVFVALNTFSQYSRRAESALFCKSFFIDLDVERGNLKKYESKDDAIAALEAFVQAVGLPPPVVVDSGNGIHAYWLLDRDVPTAEWKAYATKFKELCLAHLRIDPAITADAARILRCPESLNYKKDPPVPTKFLTTDFTEWSFDIFKEFLGEVQTAPVSLLDTLPKGLDEDTKNILKTSNYETFFQDIAEKSLNDQGCAQIKNILVNAATLEEPLWYAGLSIARHCVDWETAIHLMSEDHPEYNHANTIKKAQQAFGKPFSCDKFAGLNPAGCEGCRFRGRITNPLAVGRRLAEAPTADDAVLGDAVGGEETADQVPLFPAFLKPFTRGRTGGIYYTPAAEKDEHGNTTQPDPVLLSANDFFPIKRKYSATGGEIYVIRVVMPHEVREFDVPFESYHSLDQFKKSFGKEGVAPPAQKYWPILADYMIKWAHYYQAQGAADMVRGQMGWTQDNSAFVLGAVEIDKQGAEKKSATSPLVRAVAKMMEPRGTYEKWKECAAELNRPGFEMHAFAMGMSFGSPLMRFCSTKGMTFCFTGNTGAAKSGALIAGVSIWAAPAEASVFKSTDNAFVQRALNLKNILLGIDEVKDKDPKELSNLIHSVSQGKGKIRMQASVNAEREQELTAALISLWTSNESMIDKLFVSKRNPTGELARYMEYRVSRPDYLDENPDAGDKIFDPFNFNYGWAGREYIKYLMSLGDEEIEKIIAKWRTRVTTSRFGNDISHRFFINATSVSFAGLEIACAAGIIDYDIERIFSTVMLQSIMVRDKTVKEQSIDYEALLTEYFMDNHRGILIFNNSVSTTDIYGPLLGRIELDTGMQYIPTKAFNEFLTIKCKVSTDEMEHVLKKKGVFVGIEQKKRLTTGWKGGPMNGVRCYVFKMSNTKELVEKFINDGKTD